MSRPHRFVAGIFDLGGVLIDWNPRHLYRKLFGDDEEGMEQFLAQVTTPAWNRQMDAGRAWQEAIDELKALHPDKAELIGAYRDRWLEMLGEVDGGTAQVIRELRERGLRVFAISDWSAETFAIAYEKVPELRLFDDRVISGEERRTKPDPDLFRLACHRFGIEPGEAFFVDDVPANVEGARVVGLTALQFTGAQSLRRELRQLGVL